MTMSGIDKHGEFHAVPAIAWIASFGLCVLGDVMLGRWVLLPLLVAGFYGGTIIIALVTYPMLSSWRGWLKRRGLMAWYLVEVGGLWSATMLVLFLLSPWWLRWSWSGTSSLQVLGWVLFVGSVVAGTWAVAKMGWAALLTQSWALMLVVALDLGLLAFQLPFEERELRERFGIPYRRYCELVPRFVPRRRPVRQQDLNS